MLNVDLIAFFNSHHQSWLQPEKMLTESILIKISERNNAFKRSIDDALSFKILGVLIKQ